MVAYAIAGTPHSQGTYAMKDTGNYTSLEDLPKAEKIVGYNIHLIDRFSNGYTFTDMRVDGGAVFDENYNALKEYYSVSATYTLPEKEDITVSLYPVLDLEGSHEAPAPSSGCIIGNTEVRINRDHYKVVPVDYEKTEEDLAAEAAGHYFISYGSDEIEEYDFVSADFVLDGVDYVLLCMKADRISDEMLVQMASELIAAGVDGFQLEEGDTATEYTEAPVQARLVTSDPRNCVPSGNALDARIELAGRPGVTAEIGYLLENVYLSKVRVGRVAATIGEDGAASARLGLMKLPKGLYVLRCDFAAKGSLRERAGEQNNSNTQTLKHSITVQNM